MTRLFLLLMAACKDPVHGAYKIKAVKWFMLAIFTVITFTCPTCLSGRVKRVVGAA